MDKAQIKQLVQQMTLEEKASLTSGKNFWESQEIDRLNVPSIFFADGPHGLRKQMASADHLGLNESIKSTCFPPASTLSCCWDEDVLYSVGVALGKEARALDVNVLLGPGVNIKRNPRCGRNFEYFSEDPFLAGKYASWYIKGVQSQGVSACVKHFAVNSQEKARMIVDEIVDERALREIYLTPFEIAVKEGNVQTIMSSYNRINGDYADENPHTLNQILRKEWGYDGVVVTDWGGNNVRVDGLKCGNEIEMPTTGGETNKEIIKAIQDGILDEKVLDECVERFLSLVFKVKETESQDYDKDEHNEVALKASESSSVLLKNKGVLPLSNSEKVGIIGDFAQNPRIQGGGSSAVNPTIVSNVLENIKDYDLNYMGFEQGFDRYGKKKKGLIKKAVSLAKKCDKVLVFIGLDEVTETEGIDRTNLSLPQNQLDLIDALNKTGVKVVAVMACGAPVDMSWDERVDGVLHSYLCGQNGAKAILNLLTGKVCPSGKLAESYALDYADQPTCNYYLKNELTSEHRESIFVGYRYFDKVNKPVKYPFGFGLSYTSFEYSNLVVTQDGVSFTLTNTGSFDGAEVCQMYIAKKDSEVFRPSKELKGFKKVFLKSGESKQVTIPFDEYSFRVFDVKNDQFVIEKGEYDVIVASSSQSRELTSTIYKDGVSLDGVYDRAVLEKYFSGDVSDVSDQQFCALLGRELPQGGLNFVKKNRIVVDYNTAIVNLRYAKGFAGRLFSFGIRFAYKFLKWIGKRKTANIILMGPYYMPVRGLSRMTGGAITMEQLDSLIVMFNGKFFKGLSGFIKAGKKAKKEKKALEKTKK